jgi:uncharacterized membrane-anchored protein YhcB (DUF1043 family)
MAKPLSTFLTAAVAMLVGVAIGVIGLSAITTKLSPNAENAAQQLDQDNAAPAPQVYGSR